MIELQKLIKKLKQYQTEVNYNDSKKDFDLVYQQIDKLLDSIEEIIYKNKTY
tara:strand:+ start:490 stop:645 length:156 start_codon:yes stop_codon:yes gene_type:complete